jgi:hypothetical protein
MINKEQCIYIEKIPIKDNNYHNTLEYKSVEVFNESPSLKILKGLYVPVAKDRLYIFPDCNIPRFKVKGFCEANNLSVAKFKDTANIWFTNEDNIKGSYFEKFDYTASITKRAMLKYLAEVKIRYNGNELSELIRDIENSQANFVLINRSFLYQIKNYGAFKGPKYEFLERSDLENYDDDDKVIPFDETLIECDSDSEFYYFEDATQEADYLILSNHGDVYDESSLVSLLNSELVMDKEIYEGIKNLFESDDSSNHKVAMESMANCDYLKSAIYLLFLVKDYKSKMYNSDMKNHINFKSFLKFFDINVKYHMSFDDIVEILIKKDIMTKECLDILMPFATEQVLGSGETTYFKATNVVPSLEVIEAMLKHMPVQTAPVIEEEVEIPEIPTPEVNLNNFYS